MSRTCADVGRACYLTWGVKVVTTATSNQRWRRVRPGAGWKLAVCFPCLVFLGTGCASASSWKFWPWGQDRTSAGPQDSLVLGGTGGGYLAEEDKLAHNDLEGAKRLYQEKDYAKAEGVFA